jgi:hypothetical protein
VAIFFSKGTVTQSFAQGHRRVGYHLAS